MKTVPSESLREFLGQLDHQPPLDLREWMGLPADATVEQICQTAATRLHTAGVPDDEIVSFWRGLFQDGTIA